MLRQDDPLAGGVPPPPRAFPIRYALASKVRRVRRGVRRFRRRHDGIGWTLFGCVIAVGLGLLVGHL